MEESVDRLMAERDAHFKNLKAALQELAGAKAAQMVSGAAVLEDGTRVVEAVLREVPPELLLPLATEIARTERTVALLALGETGQLAFAKHPGVGKDLAALLKTLLAAHPGKGGGSRDFVRAKLADAMASEPAIELARRLLST